MSRPNDPLYSQQWHFPLIGDIETIWNEYTGRGVLVGVYDDGVQLNHPDLNDNYDNSQNFYYDDPRTASSQLVEHTGAPAASDHDHGTAVAGLIASEANNRLGGVGVAHGASFGSVNIFEFFDAGSVAYNTGRFSEADAWEDVFLAALSHASSYDIMSNSWGTSPLYGDYQNPNSPGSDTRQELRQYKEASETGRDGLGTVIVQASGNDSLNSNGDGINASRFTISVAATSSSGYAADYTNFGVGILLAAPDSAVTTDRTGNKGYNSGREGVPKDYTDSFGGTSAATPTVSGVVALMLEANPDLGWRDIQSILSLSASQTGEDLFGRNGSRFEVGDWEVADAGSAYSWNGGGTTFHASYGFGMLDAFAAVRMAETWLTMFDEAQTSANEQLATLNYNGSGVRIPDANRRGATISATETDDITIENAQVTVTLSHSWGTDLEIFLIAPDRTMIPLFLREGNRDTMDNGFTWTFEVTGLLGQSSAGRWSVFAVDRVGLDVGTLEDFRIQFHGSEATNNTVHFVTQDFQDLVALDSDRATISDTDGGSDWLNLVAVNSDGAGRGNVRVDLFNGPRDFEVDGEVWGRTAGGIENIISGDGNDWIRGTSGTNELYGMRGNDRLLGMAGADAIDGGSGSDVIRGGRGDDAIDGGNGFDRLVGEKGFDVIRGGKGDDVILGNRGNDLLLGNTGDDEIEGAAGRDTLAGGKGDDLLDAGRGEDAFVFREEMGSDQINGYQISRDELRFEASLWSGSPAPPTDAGELLADYASVQGNDILIDFGNGNMVELNNAFQRGALRDLEGDIVFI